MALTGNIATKTTPEKYTFVSSLNNAEEAVNGVQNRLAKMTERLCGVSHGNDAAELAEVPDGLFSEANATASRISSATQQMHEMLDRIERSLP